MSTYFIFPKPKDPSAFEDIVCDVFSRKYQCNNFQRYARNGQRQNGVDIVGPTTHGLLGIQCKNHPEGDIKLQEIDNEIKLSEQFNPVLSEYIIATSAERDRKASGHVLKLAEERKAQGKYPVVIKFWEDIYGWLSEYPDLIYKHFTQYFPTQQLSKINLPGLGQLNKTTLTWPTTHDELVLQSAKALGPVKKTDPYNLTIGLTSFPETRFTGVVDLEIQLSEVLAQADNTNSEFKAIGETFKNIKAVIDQPYFSKDVLVYVQTRLGIAFLFGWMFRKVTHSNLTLVSGTQVWATTGLPLVPSKLTDEFPVILNTGSSEVVLILNITRDILPSVMEFVRGLQEQPKAVLSYRLEGSAVENAAHALSLSLEISRKIKNIIDRWGIKRIHLFGAMPAPLATLIGFHLNAICPISLYYLDVDRSSYKLAGTLDNSL